MAIDRNDVTATPPALGLNLDDAAAAWRGRNIVLIHLRCYAVMIVILLLTTSVRDGMGEVVMAEIFGFLRDFFGLAGGRPVSNFSQCPIFYAE